MTRILIFASPAWLPFVFLGLVRALWFAAGAEWRYPGISAFVCLFVGVFVGWSLIGVGVAGDLK